MIRIIALAATLATLTARAADFRDCKELFIGAVSLEVAGSKLGGLPWDDGSDPDLSVQVKPKDRTDVFPLELVPKEQDSLRVVWGPLWPEDPPRGKWVPVRIGDDLQISVWDLDLMSHDFVGETVLTLKKDLAASGYSFFSLRFGQVGALEIFASATDGIRHCKGLDGTPAVARVLPEEPFRALPHQEFFSEIQTLNDCSMHGQAPACRRSAYEVSAADVDNDGDRDLVVKGGPFGASRTWVLGALANVGGKFQKTYLGRCDDLGPLPSGNGFLCSRGPTADIITFTKDAAGSRTPEPAELATINAGKGAAMAGEARVNLSAYFTAQKAFYQERDSYSADLAVIGFQPGRLNRYTYFGRASGDVQRRSARVPFPTASYSIVGGDEQAYPGIVVPKSIKDAGCPLTFAESPEGEPVGLGVTGKPPNQHFIGYAAGNIDSDPDFDCWSISSLPRTTKDGVTIPAGEPFHEKSDYDESAATGFRNAATSPSP